MINNDLSKNIPTFLYKIYEYMAENDCLCDVTHNYLENINIEHLYWEEQCIINKLFIYNIF